MNRPSDEARPSGQFTFEGLDRVLHEKARLGILSSLKANPLGLLFTELNELCRLTDGNLNRHMQVLIEAELVEVWKNVRGKRTQTLVRLTERGRKRFMQYIEVFEQIVSEAPQASKFRTPSAKGARGQWDWSSG